MYAIAFSMSPSCCHVSNPRRDRTRAAGMREPDALEPLDRLLEVRAGARRRDAQESPSGLPARGARRCAEGSPTSSSACSMYRWAFSLAPSDAARSAARTSRRLDALPELACVACLGIELESREDMGGDDLDELLVAVLPLLLEVSGRRQMPRLALFARERLVRHLAQEVLEEAELPALGRAGIRPGARGPPSARAPPASVSRSLSPEPDTAASAALLNVLPSTAASWTTERSSAGKPSRRAAISAWRVSGTSSASIGPVGRYSSPTCSSRPRSMSMRTVSTA